MKYILIIILSLVTLFGNAQNILQDEREPIIVETKADLQTDLELLPIKYYRDVKPDSLQKFNYTYHGRPLKGDFVLFPEKDLASYFKLASGSHDRIDFTNYFKYQNYTLNLNYLMRNDKGHRDTNIFSWENSYSLNNQKLGLSVRYLDSNKETSTHETESKTTNVSLYYKLDAAELKHINSLAFKGQFENNSTNLSPDKEAYWNLVTELETKPIYNIYSKLKFINNHKKANSQIEIYYQDISAFGLWSGMSEDKQILAPFINYYFDHGSLTLKLSNKPYTKHSSYFDYYQDHLYGNYQQDKTDYMIPGNANLELSYFNFLTWSIGSYYKYCLDAPTYRLGINGESVYYDSYWINSYYAKASFVTKNLSLTTKAEFINYNNFDADFLPFTPEVKISNSASYRLNNIIFNADYIIETNAKDDCNKDLDNSHIVNAQVNYKFNNYLSAWTELTNILNRNNNNYSQDKINQVEFKAGIKLFF